MTNSFNNFNSAKSSKDLDEKNPKDLPSQTESKSNSQGFKYIEGLRSVNKSKDFTDTQYQEIGDLYAKAVVANANKESAIAIEYLNQIIQNKYEMVMHPKVPLLLATLYYQNGDYENAIKTCQLIKGGMYAGLCALLKGLSYAQLATLDSDFSSSSFSTTEAEYMSESMRALHNAQWIGSESKEEQVTFIKWVNREFENQKKNQDWFDLFYAEAEKAEKERQFDKAFKQISLAIQMCPADPRGYAFRAQFNVKKYNTSAKDLAISKMFQAVKEGTTEDLFKELQSRVVRLSSLTTLSVLAQSSHLSSASSSTATSQMSDVAVSNKR